MKRFLKQKISYFKSVAIWNMSKKFCHSTYIKFPNT